MNTRAFEARWAKLPEAQRKEIDNYETEVHRWLAGQVPEKVFLEFRLRHGTYGQRQPNVQMQRIKIPLGVLDERKLEALAEVAEEYADGILHVTTRQDFQIHYVNILDCPDMFRRLAEAGITTREACGNTVRNVTACPQAGVCPDETFDVSPHASAMAYFLLRHPDAQDFGRKFKIAFSGCAQHHCGLARMHDIGAVARVREKDGAAERGFEVWVGGGLGAVPYQAKLLSEFVPAEEMLPLAQAIARLFAARGEKKQRARARMKFLVDNMGIDAFREAVFAEKAKLPPDPRFEAYAREGETAFEKPLKEGSELGLASDSAAQSGAFRLWLDANVRPQRQAGYSMVTVFLPLGDLTAQQMRGLARVACKYSGGAVRTTVAQNFLLRWIPNGDLPALHEDLAALELALPLANTIGDLTACPGTDTCKLGIASSRGLAGVLHRHFVREVENLSTATGNNGDGGGDGTAGGNGAGAPRLRRDVVVKMSGCFNSCGQHHIANIGFFGSSKRKGQRVAPVFQVILGGTPEGNASSYGLMVAKVAAHHAPAVVRKLVQLYDAEKRDGESFNACTARLGKQRVHDELAEFGELGDSEDFYHDNRQPWDYVKHVEQGECAGEVVTQAEFLFEDAERLVFDAQLHLEGERAKEAAETALKAMKSAADGLLNAEGLRLSDHYDTLAEFKGRFIDTARMLPGVADYFVRAAREGVAGCGVERARQLVEEANLFAEEAQVIFGRMAGKLVK
jgi:sulfite reductase (ferredoxin)